MKHRPINPDRRVLARRNSLRLSSKTMHNIGGFIQTICTKGNSVTLRSDHIAGGVFVAFGLLVFALSGDLPFGTLSFPGAGMMPKLLAGFLISFALLLILRANESAPLATIPWGDLPHAARVVAVIAAAIALYQTLGFVLTMAFLLLARTFVIERRNLFVAAGFSIGV